ncbi:tRNA (adenosine(37)-N6)-threonylcarbamoyltransferase complex dimerization subunit type 1 TsaB [Pasteurellaceae bacterium LIM206]|nr:tRNA (adenosine(37)-N6)-threonylcarbamoyltransferase complex dimerization subunit type 1 TsaB [Pasteurellaceae bacterium LIM206]
MSLTLLALDTSTEACSVALLHNGEVTHTDELAQRSHTKRILPMVDEILNRSGVRLNQLDALVFGRGPGSFTGVRVGIGIAQGLALGADLPVIPVSDLAAMAQAAYERCGARQVLAAIDARMNEVYFACFKAEKVRCQNHEFWQWHELIGEQVCRPEHVLQQLTADQRAGDWLCVGTGWRAYPQFSENTFGRFSDIILPSARYMLSLALPDWYAGKVKTALEIEPVYLRNEVTWKKLPGRD